MSIRTALINHLTNTAGVTAIFSTRIFADFISSKALTSDSMAYNILSDPPNHNQSGPSGLRRALVQLNTSSATRSGSEAGVEALLTALDGRHQQTLGSEALDVRGITCEDARDRYEPPESDKEPGRYRAELDFVIWHAP